MVWSKDAVGSISYTEYDPATGAVLKQIQDVNLNLGGTAGGYDTTYLPTAWATDAPVGQHLVTQYVVDSQGRTTEEMDPTGEVTYTVYDDANHEVRTYPGWHEVSPAVIKPPGRSRSPARISRATTPKRSRTPGPASVTACRPTFQAGPPAPSR